MTVWIQGLPKPEPRVRATSISGHGSVYKKFRGDCSEWMLQVVHVLGTKWRAMPDDYGSMEDWVTPVHGPKVWCNAVELLIDFYIPRPKILFSKKKYPPGPFWHLRRPDTTNLTKLIEDCLDLPDKRGRKSKNKKKRPHCDIIKNDSQIWHTDVKKFWTSPGAEAGGAQVTLIFGILSNE